MSKPPASRGKSGGGPMMSLGVWVIADQLHLLLISEMKLHGGMLKLITRSGWVDGYRGEKERRKNEGNKVKRHEAVRCSRTE